MDPVFKSNLPVREAQIVQHRLDLVRVRFVPATGFTDADGRSIISNVQARMGAVNVILEPLPEIPRSANGKFRAVICDLSPADKELANQAGRPDRLTTR
jgi:phenylacetate-CoA ligase